MPNVSPPPIPADLEPLFTHAEKEASELWQEHPFSLLEMDDEDSEDNDFWTLVGDMTMTAAFNTVTLFPAYVDRLAAAYDHRWADEPSMLLNNQPQEPELRAFKAAMYLADPTRWDRGPQKVVHELACSTFALVHEALGDDYHESPPLDIEEARRLLGKKFRLKKKNKEDEDDR